MAEPEVRQYLNAVYGNGIENRKSQLQDNSKKYPENSRGYIFLFSGFDYSMRVLEILYHQT
jgi:hypothetical protein